MESISSLLANLTKPESRNVTEYIYSSNVIDCTILYSCILTKAIVHYGYRVICVHVGEAFRVPTAMERTQIITSTILKFISGTKK